MEVKVGEGRVVVEVFLEENEEILGCEGGL